ncbi:STAS domain-containing protein [Aestuariirhabdus litorea]|uniref:STAS domain-containing protein n=1 Tax=Aestuariirhabdus litorea TaxID=2528527 RepID=A0A3P3VM77_9GAMM|nr:STAS domain-containing protein [Aestuariirhabdus litorea]RRJ83730.1 STAS domain-containing protein [Aestuariirhabdus litorea]RWW96953.1 STAS domain-containing protein [Endozoicomonadaceae bacterium GTF-13]
MRAQAWLSGRQEISLSGEIDFDSAPALDGLVKSLLAQAPGITWTLNMDGVLRVNSVGLALLVEWKRFLEGQQGSIQVLEIPAELVDLARVCGLDEILRVL